MASAQESNEDMDAVKVGGEEEGTSENDPSIGTETDRTDKSQDFCLESILEPNKIRLFLRSIDSFYE